MTRFRVVGTASFLLTFLAPVVGEAAYAHFWIDDPTIGKALESVGRLIEDENGRKLTMTGGEVADFPSEIEYPAFVVHFLELARSDVFPLIPSSSNQNRSSSGMSALRHSASFPMPADIAEDASGSGTNISRDGSTIVGYLDNGFFTPYHAFRWTKAAGIADLGTLDPPNNTERQSFATDVSSDGSVVIGYSDTVGGTTWHAFRWTEGGVMEDLGSGAGPTGYSRALGVSADGTVIVGESDFPGGFGTVRQAFRWTESGGFQQLGALATDFPSVATAVNADGSVVVGVSGVEVSTSGSSTNGSRAFRWTPTGGMEDLSPGVGNTTSAATGVSDDGAIVVGIFDPASNTGSFLPNRPGGHFQFGSDTRAFHWTEATGSADLNQLLATAGVDLASSAIVAATGISPGGEWISTAAVTPTTEPGHTTAMFASLTYTRPPPPDLVNLSTRAMSLGGDAAIIPGFVISGSGTKRVLVRAAGPKLQDFDVAGTMPDPTLAVYRQGETAPLATNDNWTSQEAGRPDPGEVGDRLGAFRFTPSTNAPINDTLSAALVLDLPAGLYSAVARDAQDRPGVTLVEVYDGDETESGGRFVNVSNRGFVGNGQAVTIPGFVVDGDTPQRYLIRAVGPKLGDYGLLSDTLLADPRLSVYRQGENTLLTTNDDWVQPSEGTADEVKAVMQQVGAFLLDPTVDRTTDDQQSAAVVIWLDPGLYTVVVSGANDGTGIALAEVYEAPVP